MVKPYRKDQAKYCSYDCYWGKSSKLTEKTCTKCNNKLSIKSFGKINRGWSSICKTCKAKEWKNWARRNDVFNRFRFYEWNAKRNGRIFDIDFNTFKGLVENNECFYCGTQSERLGLDRIDSKKGFFVENIAVACRRCNVAKNDMEVEEFLELIRKIAKKHETT